MRSVSLSVLAFLSMAASGAETPPQLDEYAYGFAIEGITDGGIYRLEVPLSVYRSASDHQLRDAGVFNASGDAVPRVFRRTEDELSSATTRENLPILPIYTSSARPIADIRMLVRQGDANAEVSFDANAQTPAENDTELSAYVIDTRVKSKPFTALAFEWPSEVSRFLGKVTVDASNDLVNWRRVGAGALADLQENDARVQRNIIEISARDDDYLRLQWTEMPEGWSLSNIFGLNSIENRVTNRQTLRLTSASTDEVGARLFDIGGNISVDQVSVVLPEPDSVVSGQLYYRRSGSDQWQLFTSGAFDNIDKAAEPISLPNVRTDALRFLPSNSSKGVELELDVGWRADTLMFLARGSAPFQLVVGNATDALTGFPMQRNFEDRSLFRTNGKWRAANDASLSARSAVGGESRLRASQPTDWRQFVLWAVLGFGVAIAGLMAFRLIREMKAEPKAD